MLERRWIGLGALLLVVAPNTALGEPVRGAAVAEVALNEEALGALELASVREVERKAKERQLDFERAAAESEPMRRPDGSYEFAFSDKLMRIRCLKLRSCSVALEPGEVVPVRGGLNTNGDQFPVTYVHAAGRTYASIIPQADAADADISIFTNRGRVYRLHVVAVTEPLQHMAAVSFRYPPAEAEIRELVMREEGRAPVTEGQEEAPDYQIEANMDDMYFGYQIEKEGRWRVRRKITWTPERAYDDGERTFIDLPKIVLAGERPILLVRYLDGTEALVNNASRGRHIIIGGLIEEAVLLKGVGRKQERVRIRRLKEDDSMTPIKREIVGQKRPPKSLLHGMRPFWLAGGVVVVLGIAVLWAAESRKGPRGLMGSDEATQPQLEPDMESVAALKAQAQRVEAQRAAARAEQAKQALAPAPGAALGTPLPVLQGKGPKVADVVRGTGTDDWKNLRVEGGAPLALVGAPEDPEVRKLAAKKRELLRGHEEAVFRRELLADEARRFGKSFYIPDSPQAPGDRASGSASSSGGAEEDEDYEGGGSIAALRELSNTMLQQSAKQTASGTQGLSELTGLATALGAGARGMAGGADDSLGGKSNEDRREDFFARGGDQLQPGMLSTPVKNPLSKYVLEMGSNIPGILVTAVHSESPGMITGEVSRNVYDSILQKHLLIPSGAKLVGTYSSRVAFGQERAQISWVRLVFPNGRTLDLEGMSGADPTGQAGFHDQVNRHLWAQVGAALLGAGVTVGYAATTPPNPYGIASSAHRAGAEELLKLTAKAQDRWSALPPTLSIRPGYRFLVMVDKTVYFPGVYRDTEQHGRWKSPQVARSHPPVTSAQVNAEPVVVLR